MTLRTAWSTGTILCSVAALIGSGVLGGYRDVPRGARSLDVCTTDTVHPTSGEVLAVEALIQSRLSTELNLPHASVRRYRGGCFHILLPATANPGRVAVGVTRPGYMALADGGRTTLSPGTRVTLVCPAHDSGCIPGGVIGQTDLRARPFPILQVVVPPQNMRPGSAQVATDSTGKPTIQYALTTLGADRWCTYTTHHVHMYSAIVVDGRVVSDPQIYQKICGGMTQLTGVGSHVDALRLATYINFGSYAGSGQFLKVSRNGQPVPVNTPEPTGAKICDQASLPTITPLCYTPQQLQTAYDVTPLLRSGVTGKGHTIVVIGLRSTTTRSQQTSIDVRASLRRYDRVFGLTDPHLGVIAPFGGSLRRGDEASEAVLDIEMAHTIAPGAGIVVLIPPPQNAPASSMSAWIQAPLAGMRYAIDHNLGDVLSLSFVVGEACLSTAARHQLHTVLQGARSRHISVVASSGDYGAVAPLCSRPSKHIVSSVALPASDPLVTAVGGTTLQMNIASDTYVDEIVWKEVTSAVGKTPSSGSIITKSTGGGYSRVYPRPSFQDGILGSRQQRGIPDVSFVADPRSGIPVAEVSHGHAFFASAGGTSVGAPAWAGIVALANQYAHRRLGFLNDAIYRIGKSRNYLNAFHDIQLGNNGYADSEPHVLSINATGFSAHPGWDAASGWGTPRVATLVPFLAQYARPDDGAGL